MNAGALQHKLSFQSRTSVEDDYGNQEAEFTEKFVRWTEVIPLKGGERVQAARLSGIQPVILRVRRDSDTRKIKADWQAVDVNENTVYAITSPATDMEQKRQHLSMEATIGVGS